MFIVLQFQKKLYFVSRQIDIKKPNDETSKLAGKKLTFFTKAQVIKFVDSQKLICLWMLVISLLENGD